MREELLRQSFLGEHSDDVLAAAHVAIVGLGGGGSHISQQLAHVGVGTLSLFDEDVAERRNLNRLVGATQQDVAHKTPKVQIAERLIRGVNPDANVNPIEARWQTRANLLREADVIVGCVDSFSERMQLEAAARAYLTPHVDIGMDVTDLGGRYAVSGQIALSMPGRPCLKCMGIITDGNLEKEMYGAAGGKPQVVWPNGLLASAAVGIVVELLTPWFPGPDSILLRFEGNQQHLTLDRGHAGLGDAACPHYLLSETGDPFCSDFRA